MTKSFNRVNTRIAFFFSFLLLLSDLLAGQNVFDITKLTEEQLKDTSYQHRILDIADSLTTNYRETEAIELYNRIIPFIKSEDLKAQSIKHRSICYYYTSDYSRAIESLLPALNYYRNRGDSSHLPDAYNILGLSYRRMGLLDSAMVYFYQALGIVEMNGSAADKSDSYYNLSAIHSDLKEYPKALDFMFKSLKLDIEAGDSTILPSTYNGIATTYYLMKKKDSTEYFHLKALQINDNNISARDKAAAYDGLGRIYNDRNEHEKALTFLNKAYEINMSNGYKTQAAISLNNISAAYYGLKNYNKAIEYALEALKVNKELNHRISWEGNLKNLSNYYAKAGDFQNAYKYKDQYEKLHDSIFQEDIKKKYADYEVKYETAKKDKEIALQELELQKRASTIRKQNITILFSLIAALLLMAILLVILYYKRKTKEKNMSLGRFNIIVDSQENCPEKIQYPENDNIASLAKKIEEHFRNEEVIRDPQLTQSRLSQDLGSNTSYISKAFSQYLNTSFNDYVNKKRIALSKKMIRETDMKFNGIAGQCGFNTYSAFIKVFIKHTGMTPKEYRRTARQLFSKT